MPLGQAVGHHTVAGDGWWPCLFMLLIRVIRSCSSKLKYKISFYVRSIHLGGIKKAWVIGWRVGKEPPPGDAR